MYVIMKELVRIQFEDFMLKLVLDHISPKKYLLMFTTNYLYLIIHHLILFTIIVIF